MKRYRSARYAPLRAASFVAAFALAAALAGCLGDAERGNPLDPLSGNFRDAGGVAGVVTEFYPPFAGLGGATVRLTPLEGGAELVARAGGDGRFSFPAVATGAYAVRAEVDGYASAADTVAVPLGRLAEVALRLDALPRIVAQAVHTERINRFFPDPTTFSRLVVTATVEDPDGIGDVVAVDLVIPDFEFRAGLLAVPGQPGVYTRAFLEEELPAGLQNLLGRNLFIEARDEAGAVARGGDVHVTRIVESIPQAVSPRFEDPPVRPPFELTWAPLTLPYTFTWRVELIYVPAPGVEQPAGTLANIPSGQTHVTVTGPLPPGNYRWTVSAVDVFGNFARSLESGFRVAP